MGRKNVNGPGEFADFGERFKQAVADSRHAGKGTHALGKLFDVSHNTINKWQNGHSLPAIENCIAIGNKLEVSLDWLLLGRGKMRAYGIHAITDHIGHLPKEDQAMILGFIAAKESAAKEAKR